MSHKFSLSHVTSPNKIRWRAGNLELYRATSGKDCLEKHESFITLSGPCCKENGKPISYSEYHQVVVREQFCRPEQYVSIEGRDKKAHEKNSTIVGPTWLWGDFAEQFAGWYDGKRHAAFISADLMVGAVASVSTIDMVLDVIKSQQKRNRFSLVIFNILSRCLLSEGMAGFQYADVWETIRDNSGLSKLRKGFERVDYSSYWSGDKLTTSEMTQVAFAYRT